MDTEPAKQPAKNSGTNPKSIVETMVSVSRKAATEAVTRLFEARGSVSFVDIADVALLGMFTELDRLATRGGETHGMAAELADEMLRVIRAKHQVDRTLHG